MKIYGLTLLILLVQSMTLFQALLQAKWIWECEKVCFLLWGWCHSIFIHAICQCVTPCDLIAILTFAKFHSVGEATPLFLLLRQDSEDRAEACAIKCTLIVHVSNGESEIFWLGDLSRWLRERNTEIKPCSVMTLRSVRLCILTDKQMKGIGTI